MENKELCLKNLTGKDEKNAIIAATHLVENIDVQLFKMLVEKSDYLFDFVRNNVCKRIEKVISKNNFLNIIKFFEVYSPYYDDLFAKILSKYADENLTDEIFVLLENGTTSQKIYAAKYFTYIPDTIAIEILARYTFDDNEYLSFNSAEALGQMKDNTSFELALSKLDSDDDFDKLIAVKFFVAYGSNYPFEKIFMAMKNSKMPENIAGQIPYMTSLLSLLNSDYKQDSLLIIENILSGLGEILPLSDIFQFELYDVLDFLIKQNKHQNANDSKVSVILLNALSKFRTFTENQEYIFDEEKDVKNEVVEIAKLLETQGNEFWDKQQSLVIGELNKSDEYIISALSIISEYSLVYCSEKLVSLLQNKNEIIVCEVILTLKQLGKLDGVDIDSIIDRIQNPNIKAVIQNAKA